MDGQRSTQDSIDEVESLEQQLKRERDLTIQLLRLTNSSNNLDGLMRETTKLLQEWSGCTAVGIRLRDGDDYPYFETRGFPAEFVHAESSLCRKTPSGQVVRDNQGNPVLECMCGNVLCGRFDPSLPFFTSTGNFWTNSTSELLATTTEADRQTRTRNRCHGEDYESVALIALRSDGVTFGLLQLNDHQAGRFTPRLIATLETVASAMAEAIARRLAVEQLEDSRNDLREQMDKVKESERDLRGLLDAVDQSVMLLEPDGIIRDCNQTFAERLRHSREELLGQDVYGLLPSEVAEQRRQRVEEARHRRSTVSFVDERWGRRIAHRIVPILDGNDDIVRFAVQGADITDQSRMAEGLQASNELLDAIKNAQELFISNTDPKVVFAGLLKILVGITQSEYGFLDEVVYQDGRPVLKRSLAISDISWDEHSRELYQELAEANFVFLNLENLAGAPALFREVVISNDPSHDSRSQGVPHGHPPVESFLGIPMRYGDEVVGVAGVANRTGGYTEEIAETLEPLTSACAAMIVAIRAQREKEEAHHALRRSESHFKILYEQAPLGYQSLDEQGRFLDVNQAWLDLLGYTREEVLGKSFAEFLAPEERPLFEQRFPLFKQVGSVHNVEFEMICKHERSIVVSIDGQIATDNLGRFVQTHCILHDITAQRRAESLLQVERDLALAAGRARRVNEIVRIALDLALKAVALECGGVYLFDSESQTLQLSDHEGISPEFAQATKSHELDSRQGQMLAAGHSVQLDAETLATSDFAPAVKEGLKHIIAVPMMHDGCLVGSLNVGSRKRRKVDKFAVRALETITAQLAEVIVRLRSQENLREKEAELRAIYDSSPVMMCLLDDQRRLLYLNKTMADFVGVEESQLIGQRACGVLGCVNALEDPHGCGYGHDCESCTLRQALIDTLETGKSYRNVERHMTIARGDERREVVLSGSTSLIDSAAGVNLLLTLEDVTERKEAEKKLKLQATVLDQIADRVVVTDFDGIITYLNNSAASGVAAPGELVGKSVELYGEDSKRGATQKDIIESTLRDGRWRGEIVNFANNGEEILVDCRTQVITNETGQPFAMCGISTDITELKRSQEALLEAHRNLRAIWSIASLTDADPETVYEHVIDTVASMTESPLSFFGFLDDDESKMTVYGWGGKAMENCSIRNPSREFTIAESGVWAEAVRQREALVLNDYTANHPAKTGYPQGHVPLSRLLVVPIFCEDRIVSVVAVANRDTDYSADDVKQLTAFMGGIHEVIRRKQTEEALQESERRLQELAANIPGAVYQFVRHPDGSYEVPYMSEGAVALLDQPLEVLQGPEPLFGNVHPEDQTDLRASIEESATTLNAWLQRFRIELRGGGYRWLRGASNPHLLDDGSILWNGVLLDITEAVEAEKTARVMAEMLDIAPNAILIHDYEGRLLYANRKAAEMHGYESDEFMNLTVEELDDPTSYASFEQRIGEVRQEEEMIFEVNHLRKDGTVVPVEILAKNVDWAGFPAVLSIGTDITERKQAERALQESERSVRARLDAILKPDGDIGSLSLRDIVDMPAVQEMMDQFYQLTHFPIGIVDIKGNVLLAVGWQDVCMNFHRRNPVTLQNYVASDLELTRGIEPGCFRLYKCKNNMWDMATPIVIGGEHVGNVFFGQFLFDDDELDEALIRNQACEHGFDEEAYVAAFRRVPRWSRETVETTMDFYRRLTDLVSSLSYSNIRLARVLDDQKRIEKTLREAVLRQQEAVRAGDVGLWDWNLATNCVSYSAEWKRQIGYEEHEISDSFEEWECRVHPDDLTHVMDKIQCFIATGSPSYEIEFRFRHRDGRYLWILTRASLIKNENGQTVRVIGSHVDITDRKNAEEALRQSEELYRALITSSPAGVLVLQNGLYTFANDAAKRLLGYEPHETIDQPALKLIHPDSREMVLARMRSVEEGEQNPPIEMKILRKDGATLHTESTSVLVTIEGLPSTLIICQDITKRKQLQLQLRDSESLLSQAEAIAEMGSFVWDLRTDGFTSSVGMRRLHGLSEAEFPKTVQNALGHLVHPEDRQRVEEAIRRVVAKQQTRSIEFRIQRSDDAVRLISCEARPIFDGTDRLVRLIGTVHDITRQRADETRLNAMQLQLNHTSRLAVMGELLAGIAHEVNQPLCSIINFSKACANVAEAESVDLDQIRRWSDAINTAANRAGDIVRRLLGFARRHGTEWEAVGVKALIGDAVLLVSHEAKISGVEICIDQPENEVNLHVQPGQIEQVLVNLLRNGIDAVNVDGLPEKRIVLTVDRQGDEVELSVSDSGGGVPDEQFEKLFEPFFTTKPRGLGLGLAISRTIIEDHGGQIKAERDAGSGLTFRFTLPFVKESSGDE